jgi:hypothetical protein
MTTKNNATTPTSTEGAPRATTGVQSPSFERLNGYELQAIENLVAWVAEEQDTAPEAVRSITEARFGMHSVAAVERKDYDDVIRFLVELRLDEVKQ